jgi:hypothetical protein
MAALLNRVLGHNSHTVAWCGPCACRASRRNFDADCLLPSVRRQFWMEWTEQTDRKAGTYLFSEFVTVRTVFMLSLVLRQNIAGAWLSVVGIQKCYCSFIVS